MGEARRMNEIKCKDCGKELKSSPLSPRPSDCQLIAQVLDKARPWGLEAEVMWCAMRHYEKFHESAPETYSMEWALGRALIEWDI